MYQVLFKKRHRMILFNIISEGMPEGIPLLCVIIRIRGSVKAAMILLPHEVKLFGNSREVTFLDGINL